jgi:hypothetical protein
MDLRVPCRRIYRRCAQAARLCQENMYRAYGSPVHRYASFNGLKSLSDRVIQAGIVTRYVEATPLWSDRNGQGLCIAPGAADLLELDLNFYGFSRAVGSFHFVTVDFNPRKER